MVKSYLLFTSSHFSLKRNWSSLLESSSNAWSISSPSSFDHDIWIGFSMFRLFSKGLIIAANFHLDILTQCPTHDSNLNTFKKELWIFSLSPPLFSWSQWIRKIQQLCIFRHWGQKSWAHPWRLSFSHIQWPICQPTPPGSALKYAQNHSALLTTFSAIILSSCPRTPLLSLTASAAFQGLFPLLGSLYPFPTKGNRILQGQRSLLCSNSSHGSHLTQMRSQNPHLSVPGLLSSVPHLISCYFPHFHPLHTSQLADLWTHQQCCHGNLHLWFPPALVCSMACCLTYFCSNTTTSSELSSLTRLLKIPWLLAPLLLCSSAQSLEILLDILFIFI